MQLQAIALSHAGSLSPWHHDFIPCFVMPKKYVVLHATRAGKHSTKRTDRAAAEHALLVAHIQHGVVPERRGQPSQTLLHSPNHRRRAAASPRTARLCRWCRDGQIHVKGARYLLRHRLQGLHIRAVFFGCADGEGSAGRAAMEVHVGADGPAIRCSQDDPAGQESRGHSSSRHTYGAGRRAEAPGFYI